MFWNRKKYLFQALFTILVLSLFLTSMSYACTYKNLEDWGLGFRDSTYVDNEFVFRGTIAQVTLGKKIQPSGQLNAYQKVFIKIKVSEEIVHKTWTKDYVTIEYNMPSVRNPEDNKKTQNYFVFGPENVGEEYVFLTTTLPNSGNYNLWTRYTIRKGRINLKSGILGCDDFGVYNSDVISLKALRNLLHPRPNKRGMNPLGIFQL